MMVKRYRKQQLYSSSCHEHGHSCATTMNHFVNLAETVITTKFGILVASGDLGDLFCICHISNTLYCP